MIQVCSRCGTRWNVRDKQRSWCPRCNGTLLAPAVTEAPQTSSPSAASSAVPGSATRLPPGYRWIAVRPGPPPSPRRRGRPLGPTPRYLAIPRWGLLDRVEQAGGRDGARSAGPTADLVRTTFLVTMAALGAAALVLLLRYVLLVINRDTLLHWLVAAATALLSVLASLAAIAMVMASSILLTWWLVARRAAAFEHAGRSESRPRWALWVGTLLPPTAAMVLAIIFAVVTAITGHSASWALMAGCVTFACLPLLGLVWALVYVIELAKIEASYGQFRRVIWTWWLMWLLSSVTSVFASATSGARDAQGIANNTVAMIVAYLVALAAALATRKVFERFERKPVERPAHRWVVVADAKVGTSETAAAVELPDAEPAA